MNKTFDLNNGSVISGSNSNILKSGSDSNIVFIKNVSIGPNIVQGSLDCIKLYPGSTAYCSDGTMVHADRLTGCVNCPNGLLPGSNVYCPDTGILGYVDEFGNINCNTFGNSCSGGTIAVFEKNSNGISFVFDNIYRGTARGINNGQSVIHSTNQISVNTNIKPYVVQTSSVITNIFTTITLQDKYRSTKSMQVRLYQSPPNTLPDQNFFLTYYLIPDAVFTVNFSESLTSIGFIDLSSNPIQVEEDASLVLEYTLTPESNSEYVLFENAATISLLNSGPPSIECPRGELAKLNSGNNTITLSRFNNGIVVGLTEFLYTPLNDSIIIDDPTFAYTVLNDGSITSVIINVQSFNSYNMYSTVYMSRPNFSNEFSKIGGTFMSISGNGTFQTRAIDLSSNPIFVQAGSKIIIGFGLITGNTEVSFQNFSATITVINSIL